MKLKLVLFAFLILLEQFLWRNGASIRALAIEESESLRKTGPHRCMDWHAQYLHSMKIIEPQFSLIYHSAGGLSDSLTGMVSAFLISYALRRRFYLSNDNILIGAINSKVINVAEQYETPIRYQLHKKTGMNLILRLHKNLGQEIHLIGNRGSVFKIINSKEFEVFDRLHLRALGTDFVFGCLLNLLAVPTTNTLKNFNTELMKLQQKDIYKIGLQIRTFETLRGAKEKTRQEYLRQFQLYADCVKNIRKQRNNVLVFVISDSNVLRKAFVDHFKSVGYDSFTTNVSMNSILAPWWTVTGKTNSSRIDKVNLSPAEAAFGESFLYSLNDAYVYTKKSGFGRVAAASGMRSAAYFPIGRRSITSAGMCGKRGFSMSHIEQDSAGLR